MKKFLVLLLVCITIKVNAQNSLSFNKRFIECEDKWITFQMDEDSSYTFGFIYIDAEAGLTLNLEGNFKVQSDDSLIVEKNKESNIKIRLENNGVRVAIIPEAMYNDLQIDSIPDWLRFYKTDVDSISRLYKWGFMYNGWGLCDKALNYLLKAKSINPEYIGLSVELAYSYNCLKQYDLSENVLIEALQANPTDAYTNKEYIYTLIQQQRTQEAIDQYEKSIQLKIDNTHNAENCFNILAQFYSKKDEKNFKIWVKELKKWPNNNKQIEAYVKTMKKEIKK